MKEIYPVIHFKSVEQALENTHISFDNGCNGVFIIDMSGGKHPDFKYIYEILKNKYPNKLIGLNHCNPDPVVSAKYDYEMMVDMSWEDNPGIHTECGDSTLEKNVKYYTDKNKLINPNYKYFGSVAFKTQFFEPNPSYVMYQAYSNDWIPTTSGTNTGVAPETSKIVKMKQDNPTAPLAIASGITPDNIHLFKDYVDYYLVATGISKDFYSIDDKLLESLVINLYKS